MTKTLLVVFGSLLCRCISAQHHVADSIQCQLEAHAANDTIRVELLNSLSFHYQWLDFSRSLAYAEEAAKLATELSFQRGIATANFRQAHCYWALGDSDLAIEKGLRAVSIAQESGLLTTLAETYRILAICYRDQQETEKAFWYIKQAERLAIQEKNWDLLARIHNLAGVIDYTRMRYDSALFHYQESIRLADVHSTTRFHLSQALSNIGEIYLKNDPVKALDYFRRALASAIETQNRSAEAGIKADIGRAYVRMKRYDEGNAHLQQSLKMARALGLRRVIRHVYLALTDLHIRQENTTEAFNYMRAYYDVRDSLLNNSKTRQIVELEKRFEAEKQEQRIKLLEQEKRIQSLWQNILLVGSISLTVALIIIYRLQQLRSRKAQQLLETQRALTDKLKETDALKSRFFANLSHEFRTPLTLILSPVGEQLKDTELTSSARKTLSMIQRNALRLLTLVNQLLDLSKAESGKMELSARQGDIAKFLGLLLSSFDSLAEHRQIHFSKNISTHPVHSGFDPDKVEKIVTNILFNAFKFTPSGGQVVFSMDVSDVDRHIILTVADTGKGIPIEEQKNIFSPFYQLKNDVDDGQPGTGLGLSLVHELVKIYGGRIELSSSINKGTRITVTLPMLPVDPQSEIPDDRTKQSMQPIITNGEEALPVVDIRHEGRETLLVVEDNADLRNFILSGFTGDLQTISAQDGEMGLQLANERIPDVIISDVMMPKMNGFELTNHIRANLLTSHIPIILLTAKADDGSRLAGLKTGADDYLAKPFSLEELQIRIRNVLDRRKRLALRLRQELFEENYSSREPSLDEKFLAKVRDTIEKNIGNSFFSVETLAGEMNLSRAQLFRKLKALINCSPSEFINDVRLQRAAALIKAKVDNVAQIGYTVGFNEQSYFAKRFRKKFGVSPTEYGNDFPYNKNTGIGNKSARKNESGR